MRWSSPLRGLFPSTLAIERWRSRSLAGGWPVGATAWTSDAGERLCEELSVKRVNRPAAMAAARALGEHRANADLRLHEARADFALLLDVFAMRGPARCELVDAFTIGWAEAAVERVSAVRTVDDGTDLATLGYLRLRLRELYRQAAVDPARDYLLVVVETDLERDPLLADGRLAALYSAAECAFLGGESLAAVSDRRVAVLARRLDPRLPDALERLRSELDVALAEDRLSTARCWSQPLPERLDELPMTLLGVRD